MLECPRRCTRRIRPGLVEVRVRSLEALATLAQQPSSAGPPDPPPVHIHGVVDGELAAPASPAAVRLRHVAATTLGKTAPDRQHRFDLLRRRDQRLAIEVVSPALTSCTVTPTTAPVSRSTACSALWARCVRPSFIWRNSRP